MLYTMPNGTQFRDPQPVTGFTVPPATRSFERLCTEVVSTEVKNWFHTFKMYGHFVGNSGLWVLTIVHINGEPTGIDYSMDETGQLFANAPMFPHFPNFSSMGIFAVGQDNA